MRSKAVRFIDGPILLLAVPGSGKTTIIRICLRNTRGKMFMIKNIWE